MSLDTGHPAALSEVNQQPLDIKDLQEHMEVLLSIVGLALQVTVSVPGKRRAVGIRIASPNVI